MVKPAGPYAACQPASPDLWAERAACARPGALSMEMTARGAHERKATERLLQVCRKCPVLTECRTWALTDPDPAIGHVAGGLTPNSRAAWPKHEVNR